MITCRTQTVLVPTETVGTAELALQVSLQPCLSIGYAKINKNGRRIQGKIKKEEKDKLVLEVWLGSTTGEITFYSDAIEKIIRE